RRRHTRCYRDWSSDVCSSDLTHCGDRREPRGLFAGRPPGIGRARGHVTLRVKLLADLYIGGAILALLKPATVVLGKILRRDHNRSEERRVGKECRLWGRAYDE